MRLFAVSTRNLLPRLINNLCIAAVGICFVGPIWSCLWFVAVWAPVFIGIGLTNQIQARPRTRRAAVLGHCLTVTNVVSGGLSVAMPAALWSTGDPLAQGFAFVTLFVGATYVLLQYYANPRMFFILLSPYALALAYIGSEFAAHRGLAPIVTITLVAAAISLANFFRLSRSMLDGSRSALRKARAEARAGEAAAELANESKSAFLAIMSYEIRTPLNGVLGMAQAMAAGTLSRVQRGRLGVLRQSGEGLLAILNDILDLSKIEAGKLQLEEIDFDLAEVVHGAHAAFTALANQKGVAFSLDIQSARGRYRGDPTRLRQILQSHLQRREVHPER